MTKAKAIISNARRPRKESVAAPSAITLDDVRMLLRDQGVLWGRDALRRYKVKGFSKMTPAQLAEIHAELTAAGSAIERAATDDEREVARRADPVAYYVAANGD